MKLLIELINLFNSNTINKASLIPAADSQTKIAQFYHALKEGKVASDEEALAYLYENENENEKVEAFKKLKTRLKSRLLNSLLFINVNQPHFTDIQKAYYECYKQWVFIRILIGRSAKESAAILSKRIFKKALHFEFTEIVLNLCRMLRMYHATVKGDQKAFRYYNQLLKKYLLIYEAEMKAEEYYADLLVNFVSTRASKKNLVEKAREYALALQPYREKVDSFNFIFFAHTIFTLQYEIDNDHESVIEECLKALRVFEQKPYKLKSQVYGFASKAFYCYIKLGQFQEAERMGKRCMKLIEPGSVNWFKFQEALFYFLCQIERYDEVPSIVNKVIRNANFEFQSEASKEVWKVYEAYAYWLSRVNSIQNKEAEKLNKNFKLGKFINQVPAHSKDKEGMNITILVIQILILLSRQKYDQIIDRISALERYTNRYLKKDATFRSNCFMRMIIALPKGHFNRTAIERHTQKYIQMLENTSLAQSDQSSELEIIPYEKLWNLTLKLCKPLPNQE
ncbi:MAG TPA: hypothetical protein PKA00_05275 [Saprospiraceae bacterium]|nr:hypothetical protein [Saprospiraceae bacterium]HMQ82293.1 hypothetical protein [Saprospiraceae bacterium]